MLENLRLAATDLTVDGIEQLSFFGKAYPATKFAVTAQIRVQTLCVLGSNGKALSVYAKVPADFEILVAADRDRSAHDTLVQEMYKIWSRAETYSGTLYFDFNSKGNAYTLTALPDLVNVKVFYYVWVNERLIQVTFKGFSQKGDGGLGKMDAFTSDVFRVRIDNEEFRAFQYPHKTRKRFLEWYQQGRFKT